MQRSAWVSALRSRANDSALRLRHAREVALYERYRSYTMLPRGRFVDSLLLAKRATQSGRGDLVECGTWRGGMSAAMAQHAGSDDHRSVLFDSFAGLPPADEALDGAEAVQWQRDGTSDYFFDNCTADEREARAAMSLARRPFDLHKGFFAETLPLYASDGRPISLLRLDGDWYESISICLRMLFPLVNSDGIVIIDDYGYWDGCTRAVHDYLASERRTEPIQWSPRGQAYVVKRRA